MAKRKKEVKSVLAVPSQKRSLVKKEEVITAIIELPNKPAVERTAEERPNIVNLLLDLQKEKGYLPREELIRLSKRHNIPGVEINGVVTFYSQFKLTPQGKYVVSICRGTACHVKGSADLLEYAEELLGIKSGNTTPDGRITLEKVNCIGACAKAPAMMINGTVHGELDRGSMKKIISGLP